MPHQQIDAWDAEGPCKIERNQIPEHTRYGPYPYPPIRSHNVNMLVSPLLLMDN